LASIIKVFLPGKSFFILNVSGSSELLMLFMNVVLFRSAFELSKIEFKANKLEGLHSFSKLCIFSEAYKTIEISRNKLSKK
jgi:hypothetical protein